MKIVIELEGGLVTAVHAEGPAEITVIDWDIENSEEEVLGETGEGLAFPDTFAAEWWSQRAARLWGLARVKK